MRYRRAQRRGLGAHSKLLAAVGMVFVGWVDLTTNTSITGLASAALSIPYVNPPPKNNADKRVPVTPVPFFVRMRWGDGLPHDIDLWVRCKILVDGQPTEITVGYAQRSHRFLDLLRDDLGGPSVLNEEQVQSNSEVTRVPPNSTCWINAHLYNSHGGAIPVRVNVIVILNKDADNEYLLGNVDFDIVVPGQEVTALIASWGAEGQPIKESVKVYPAAPQLPIATDPKR